MTSPICKKEPLVSEAARCGKWDEDLRRHVLDCLICAEAVLAVTFLQQMRPTDQEGVALPNAGQAWWKAQLKARRDAVEQVTQPVCGAQSVALLCAVLCAIGIFVWQWDSLGPWLTSLSGLWHFNPAPGLEYLANLWNSWQLILIAGAGGLVVFVSLIIWLVRSED